MGSYSSKLGPGSYSVEGTMDDSKTHAIRLWEQDVGSFARAMGSQLCSYTCVQAIRIRAVHSRHLWTQSVRVRLWRSGLCSLTVTPQIRDVTGQRQTYTYASEALTYRTSGMTFPL